MIDAFIQDLRYAIRGLRAKPGFAAAVILTLGLGIGANAAMFSIVDRMLFRPPPYLRDPAMVHRVYVGSTRRGKESFGGVSMYARYQDVASVSTKFSSAAGYTTNDIAVGVGDAARETRVASVSASFFGFFDAPPAVGRYFTTTEDSTPKGASVVVLSHATWQVKFGERADALGAKVQIGPEIYTVIGVAPPGFVGLWPEQPPAYFIPITSRGAIQASSMTMKESWWRTYHWGWMSMIVRRKPGVTLVQANADLTKADQKSYSNQLIENPKMTSMALAKPRALAGSILAERGPNESNFAKVATWVGGVAVIVLIVACANVANLLLARAIRRRREIALRLALGISRARLLSQLLTESLILAFLGGAAAILIAQWGGAALQAGLMPKSAPAAAVRDSRTLMFTALAAMVVGVLMGLAPAWQTRSADLTSDLKAGSREGTFHRSRLRVALLVLQGAMSVMLLVGAGLFVRSLNKVQAIRMGYDVTPIALVDYNMRGVTLDSTSLIALRHRLLDRAKALPGVENASLQTSVPFWSTWSVGLWVEGIDTVSRLGQFNLNSVSPEYFATLGTKILRGRAITDADRPPAPGAMVVSEAMAKTLWPNKEAVGQCIKVNADTMPCTYVVGVAENIKSNSINDDTGFFYYLSSAQFNPQSGGVFVRVHGDATKFIELIRRELQHEMPGASYITVTPFSEIVGSQKSSWTLGATMFVAFGLLALVIAAIGLYSVIAYNVAQRTHEMGVRVALGAQAGDVVRMVVSEGFKLGAVGVLLGAVGMLLVGKWLKPLLFDESPRDPAVFAGVTLVLLVVTIAASWIPARRASCVDPSVALRSD
ncbi:MAG: ABC transporter permease [Gemmatimonadaceae bacterium]